MTSVLDKFIVQLFEQSMLDIERYSIIMYYW